MIRFRALTVCLLGLPFLTGCLYHTRQLQQPKSAGPALDEGAAQLVMGVNERYNSFQTLSATVEFSAQIGGAKRGKETDTTSFGGYILLRKPDSLRVLGLVPVLRTHAFDLASDGTTFKLYIPYKNKAITGPNSVTEKSANAIENLRPNVFFDSVLVPAIPPDRLVELTKGSTVTMRGKEKVETPEYNLSVVSPVTQDGNVPVHIIQPQRIIHFDRTTLLPNGQDTYNAAGEIETRVRYGPYQHFGNALFPGVITIERPLEEYQITITVDKLTVNQTLNDEQFQLTIPPNVPTQHLK
jgi:outer membrane lipoprotein-sorting protein